MELKEILKNKNFEDYKLNFIKQAMKEFYMVFKGHFPIEKILLRINDRIDKIDFVPIVFDKKESLGVYFSNTIQILQDLDEDKKHSVFFHEFTHAIVGSIFYYLYPGKSAIGLTEGFTEMLTKRRNKLVGFDDNKVYTYPILAKQFENLLNILGNEKTLPVLVEDINNIRSLMIENGLIDDDIEFDDYAISMDCIAKYEKEIFKRNMIVEEQNKNKFFQAIFGKNKLPADVKTAQTNVIMTHLKIDTNSINEYNNKVNIAKQYSKELAVQDCGKIFWNLYDELKKCKYNINYVDPIIKDISSEFEEIKKHLANSEKQRLEQLSSDNNFIQMINSSQFSDYYKHLISEKININISDKNYLYDLLINGLAQKILKDNIKPETVGIETISKDEYYNIYNLYISNGTTRKYCGTFNTQSKEKEYIILSDKKEINETRQLLDDAYKLNLAEGFIEQPTAINNSSIILANPEENDYLISNTDGSWWNIIYDPVENFYDEMELSLDTNYNLSYIESKLVSANWRLQNCLNLDTDMRDSLVSMQIETINNILSKYSDNNIQEEKDNVPFASILTHNLKKEENADVSLNYISKVIGNIDKTENIFRDNDCERN